MLPAIVIYFSGLSLRLVPTTQYRNLLLGSAKRNMNDGIISLQLNRLASNVARRCPRTVARAAGQRCQSQKSCSAESKPPVTALDRPCGSCLAPRPTARVPEPLTSCILSLCMGPGSRGVGRGMLTWPIAASQLTHATLIRSADEPALANDRPSRLVPTTELAPPITAPSTLSGWHTSSTLIFPDLLRDLPFVDAPSARCTLRRDVQQLLLT